MGFGLLLVGYFMATMMSLHAYGVVFSLIGYIIVAIAAKKLAQYHTSFYILLFAVFPMLVLTGILSYQLGASLLNTYFLTDLSCIPDNIQTVIAAVKEIYGIITVGALCYSVRRIAVETGAKKVPYLAVRNFVFSAIALALQAFSAYCMSERNETLFWFAVNTVLPVWALLLNIFMSILVSLMLFSCYRQICDEGDVEMPQKPSRFEFVNRRRKRKEQRKNEYLESRGMLEKTDKTEEDGDEDK